MVISRQTKQKVQKQVEDIADNLIKLYAERSQLKGFAFHQMMRIRLSLTTTLHMWKPTTNFVPLTKLEGRGKRLSNGSFISRRCWFW